MQVTVSHVFTRRRVTRDLPVDQERLDRWKSGEPIQRVFPELSVSDREWLMTGLTDAEWEAMALEEV